MINLSNRKSVDLTREYKDMYCLYKRIKLINLNYVLIFNAKTKNFEIHDKSNRICSLCLTISPKDLNEKILDKLYISRKENMKKYFMQIDLENSKRENECIRNIFEKTQDAFGEILSVASRLNHELSQNEMKNIISNLGD